MKIPYCSHEPTELQEKFLTNQDTELLWSAGFGAGKSQGLLMGAAQYAYNPDCRSLLLASTYGDLVRPGGLLNRVLSDYEGSLNERDGIFTFPSGATIMFSHWGGSPDWHLRLRSCQFQYIGFDECETLDEAGYRYLFSKLRRDQGGEDLPPRIRVAGSRTPVWLKELYLDNALVRPPWRRSVMYGQFTDNPHVDAEAALGAIDCLAKAQRALARYGDWEFVA